MATASGGVPIEATVTARFTDGFELVTKIDGLEGSLKADAQRRLMAKLYTAKNDLE